MDNQQSVDSQGPSGGRRRIRNEENWIPNTQKRKRNSGQADQSAEQKCDADSTMDSRCIKKEELDLSSIPAWSQEEIKEEAFSIVKEEPIEQHQDLSWTEEEEKPVSSKLNFPEARVVPERLGNIEVLSDHEVKLEIKDEPLDVLQEEKVVKDGSVKLKLDNQKKFPGHIFYGHRNAALEPRDRTPWVAPNDAEGSDVDVSPLDVDSDDDDPTHVPDECLTQEDTFDHPNARSRRVNVVVPQEMPLEDEGEVNPKRPCVDEWKKDDIDIQPLPDFIHPQPDFLREPFEYFSQFFTAELREHIVYQSNLYSKQKDEGSNFHISEEDLMVFLGLIVYMSLVPLPSIVDFWAVNTRIPQVADFMSRNRFEAIRSSLHFNDNDQAAGSQDRFFKVRVPFTKVTREFQKVPETPIHSIDEVMVAYKATRAGNLRQYVAKKPDKWGYKLFCRSSVDGFVHDILMYQGETTFVSHPTLLSEEEKAMSVTSKIVVSLVKTIKDPSHAAVYADNYFTSIGLAKYLRSEYECRYVGTARENRVGHPPLKSVKEMSKKTTQRGTLDYVSSDGILVARWKDNSVVTILSTDVSVEPMGTVERYDRAQKKKVPIPCPSAIQMYNNRMGGIDKSDMLTDLYETPFKGKRYYMRLFAYLLDLIICNAWILYKRDCLALLVNPKPLKDFRLDISYWLRSFKTSNFKITRNSLGTRDVALPKRGQRAVVPSVESRQDATALHMPKHVTMRQTCKFCSTAGHIHRSRWMCEECKVALCLTESRNCFALFHKISK